MAKIFRPYTPDQLLLLPPSLRTRSGLRYPVSTVLGMIGRMSTRWKSRPMTDPTRETTIRNAGAVRCEWIFGPAMN